MHGVGGQNSQVLRAPVHRRLVNFLCTRSAALTEFRLADALHRCVRKRITQSAVPGVQASFCVEDRPVRTMAWGVASRATNDPMREDTRFRMASMAKPVSSLVYLRLVANGVATLDESLCPLLRHSAPHLANEPLTARMLLSHRAGLSVVHPPHYAMEPVQTARATLLNAILGEEGTTPLTRSTPTETLYTGAGWMLLERWLQQRTGKSFDALARENLEEPFGLRTLSYSDASRTGRGVADYHTDDGTVQAPTTSPAVASTGLVADTRDIVHATRMLIDAARGDRPEFLPAPLAQEAITPQPTGAPTAGFTLTHFIYSHRPYTLTHGGVRPGFRATMTVFPKQRIIACLAMNADQGLEVVKPWLGLIGSIAQARGGV